MSLPDVVTREEWLVARKELLAEEKEMTQGARPARRPSGGCCRWCGSTRSTCSRARTARSTLLDLFDGRRQLIVRHFMFDPDWDDGLPELHGRRRRDVRRAAART